MSADSSSVNRSKQASAVLPVQWAIGLKTPTKAIGPYCSPEERPDLARYRDAVRRAEAMGVAYLSSGQIAVSPDIDKILQRLEALEKVNAAPTVSEALLGAVSVPSIKVSEAFKIYTDEIMAHELSGKSRSQRRLWEKVKQRAINNFIAQVSDKPIGDITREDGVKFYKFWLNRIAPPEGGKVTHSASAGNRDLGNMRDLCRRHFHLSGRRVKRHPFRFPAIFRTRQAPPEASTFRDELDRGRIMKVGALDTLDDEARGCVLALIETGARPGEICNLDENVIFLNAPVPYIRISPREDEEDPREIKTESSVRDVPLVGIALEVFRKHPRGFPRYRNREDALSANLNEYFKAHKLFPTTRHKIYSLRHSFEDRMKEAGLDSELRKILRGHTIDRVEYGAGGGGSGSGANSTRWC